jgi:hypothetical protein
LVAEALLQILKGLFFIAIGLLDQNQELEHLGIDWMQALHPLEFF